MGSKLRLLLAILLLSLGAGLLGQEDDSQCGPVPSATVHECHCSTMVEQVQLTYQAQCRTLKTQKEQEACLNSRPPTCDVMDYPNRYQYRDGEGVHEASGHPDQCLRKCKPSQCTCSEGACQRPAVQSQPQGKKGKQKR